MGKIVAFSNQKGGVGKTTTCVNMAAYLAQKGYKCLVVDLDPQGNATSGLGFSKSEVKNSVYNVMIDEAPIESAVQKTCVDGLDILPSSIDLAGAEVELVYIKDREHVLKRVLDKAKASYDFITIDCPPSLGLLTINALAAADTVIIPIQSEYYAMEGLSQLMNTIKLVVKHLNESLRVEGVVLTMSDNRAIISRQISAEIRKFFGKRVYDTIIPRNIRLAEAPSHGVPIALHDTRCSGAKAYNALTDEFLSKQPQKKK
ncbi:MAG TPA: sporulation initiation inhibitor Soj [Clostridiales bacterium]|nr:sporulation initiation inhibitor Soj [Clostridiales bacterium]